MVRTKPKLEWGEKYSVGVVEIDNQHKEIFKAINQLVDIIGSRPADEKMEEIINALIKYKEEHFKTEEKYF